MEKPKAAFEEIDPNLDFRLKNRKKLQNNQADLSRDIVLSSALLVSGDKISSKLFLQRQYLAEKFDKYQNPDVCFIPNILRNVAAYRGSVFRRRDFSSLTGLRRTNDGPRE